MKFVATFVIGAATMLLAADVSAQTRPDFSGRWTSEAAAAAQSGGAQRGARRGDMGSGWGDNLTIAQDATRLTVEYPLFTRNDMQPPLKFVYALDGADTTNTVMMGRGMQTQTSKTAWAGNKLEITTTHSLDNPARGQPLAVEVRQTLSLETPDSLVVETTRGGVLGGLPSTTRTVYRKR